MAARAEGSEAKSVDETVQRQLDTVHVQQRTKGQARMEESTEQRLARVEQRIERLEERARVVGRKEFERLEERVVQLEASIKSVSDKLLPRVEAVLRKLEGSSSTSSNPPTSAVQPVGAVSTSPGAARTSIPPMTSEKRKALGEALFTAAREGRARDVQRLLQNGADVHYRKENWSNRTPLYIAAFKDDEDVMALLIDAGADLNIQDNDTMTPLLFAAMNSKVGAARVLITAGADVNRHDILKQTPLHAAASCGDDQVVKALIAAGADVDCQDHNKCTPLHYAAFQGYEDVIRVLIAAGASETILDIKGETPYDVASQHVRQYFNKRY